MPDREKVMQWLKTCVSGCEEGCPYEYKNLVCRVECKADLMRDALALLKEQEPRVLTLEELDIIYNAEKTHVWPFNRPPYLWIIINPDVRMTAGYWICWRDISYCLENNSPFYVRENYGKVWTIWTKEPTDEQRKAAKWE